MYEMSSTGNVRTLMLQRAARLVNGTHSEEAWYLISLFQQSQPTAFLTICHHILATFLELTHDYFDEGWPLKTRLHGYLPTGTPAPTTRQPCPNRIQDFFGTEPLIISTDLDSDSLPSDASSCRPSPELSSIDSAGDKPTHPVESNTPRQAMVKMKSFATKQLFKQLLPSKSHTPNREKASDHKLDQLTRKTILGHVTPLGSNTWNRSQLIGTRSKKLCENLNSLICRCLIDYMLQSPAIYSTEGLFRVPGNNQRIQELWQQLREQLSSTYYRLPQPDPDDSPLSALDTWGLCVMLDAYSPHDLASLLLRCLGSCYSDSPKQSVAQSFMDDFNKTSGLIHHQAGELCFMATRLQYTLEQNDDTAKFAEDWKHILCHAHQLLAYRIVLQFLIPSPERSLLLSLLRLFQKVANKSDVSRMPAECIARCAAVAIFGSPSDHSTPEQLTSSNPERNPLTWRIDTLANLIRVADRLDDLPGVVYMAVKNRLRNRFGQSPVVPPQVFPERDPNEIPMNDLPYEFNYGGSVAKKMRCVSKVHLHCTNNRETGPRPRENPITNGHVTSTPCRPALDRTCQTRASLVRAVSSLEPGRTISSASKTHLTQTGPFKFWKRRKQATALQNLRSMEHRLIKVRSSSAIERR